MSTGTMTNKIESALDKGVSSGIEVSANKEPWPRCNKGQKLHGPHKRIGPMTADNIVDHAVVDAITGCWHWKFFRLPNGYGNKNQTGKSEYAHRLAYKLTHGDIPEGNEVRHAF